jgi:hypothetical protein
MHPWPWRYVPVHGPGARGKGDAACEGSSHRRTDSQLWESRLDLASRAGSLAAAAAAAAAAAPAPARHHQQQFEIHFCPIFSPIQPFSSPNTTRDHDNDCPFCAITTRRHCARRPVAASATACGTLSIALTIAHRASRPAPTSIARQFQVPRLERVQVAVTRTDLPQVVPSPGIRPEQPAGPTAASTRRNPHPFPRSFQYLPLFHPIFTAVYPARAPGTRWDRSRHRSVPPSAIRHPPPAICHRPSPLRGAVAWPAARPTETCCWAGMQSPGYPPRSSSS